MSPEFKAFRQLMLGLDGVTMVGPEHAPCVGVETEATVPLLRRLLNANVQVVVTGPIVVPSSKHHGVSTYETVAAATKP